jgi:acyl-Coa thioesterase superfamily protein/acyl-CoA thioesterase superfamily protein
MGPGREPGARGPTVGQSEQFFRADGETLVPQPSARGPWAEPTINGRLMIAVAARAVEREHGGDGFHCARLTTDLLRPPPLQPLRVTTRAVRAGGRLRAIDAEVTADGVLVARTTALLLRRGDQPPIEPWAPPSWTMPPPLSLVRLESPETENLRMDVRPEFEGRFFADGRRRLWCREQIPLVDDEDWTPLTRAAGVADIANPLANKGNVLRFINADVTVYLAREPADEWIGLEVLDHLSDAGIALGACSLYDTAGRIGWCSVAGLAVATPPII